jgi:type I restriction enzyme S subunit
MELLYVDIGNVNILWIQNEPELLYFSEAPSRARRKVKDWDTILWTVRTYLKAIAYINNPLPNLIVSTWFAVIQPQNKMDNKYLYYQLLSEAFIQKVVANSKWVSYPAINSTELWVLKILIPSIEEQKAIADYLDSSTSQIDKTIKAVGKSIDLLTEYKQSLISNVVTGKVKVF